MESEYPLRELRRQSNLHYNEILLLGQAITEHFPRSKNHLFGIETRGTRSFYIIQALAEIYDCRVEDVAKMADETLKNFSVRGNKRLTTPA